MGPDPNENIGKTVEQHSQSTKTCNRNEVTSPMSGKNSCLVFEHKVLGKHLASYYFDEESGYIFVDRPHWLSEAYSSAITVTDTGVLSRNFRNIEICKQIFDCDNDAAEFCGVDLGAGYGLFVRGMRDLGFNFYWYDLYADNLMARGFEARPGPHSVAVAFEVLEHTINPLEFLLEHKRKFRFSRLIFSATCFDEENIPDQDWWYWAFETGQHVSFFTERSLQWMAKHLNMRVSHIEADIYVFEDLILPYRTYKERKLTLKSLSKFLLKADRKLSSRGRAGLTWSDHLMLRDRLRSEPHGE
jgi:hypothetical protein